jgi:DNA polymerase III alpha subunit
VSEDKTPEYIKIRSFLWANIPTLLESASARKEASKNDSDDLFGDNQASNEDKESKIAWQKDYPLKFKFDVLTDERETLGIYVSGNPLEDFVPILKWIKDVSLVSDIHLILVEKIRKIFTRAGGMMLALQVTTPFESLEGMIFTKNAPKFSPILEEKQLFWVIGNIKKKEKKEENEYDEKPKMTIQNLVPFGSGVVELIDSSGLNLSDNRRDALKNINWQQIKQNPSLFWQNHEPQELGQNQPLKSPKALKIPIEFGVQNLRDLKTKLKSNHTPEAVEVMIEIQTNQGWKKVKGSFWIAKTELEPLKSYIES